MSESVQLTLAAVTALEAIAADIKRLERKRSAIMTEAGLEAGVTYAISPDGVATPQGTGDPHEPVAGEKE